MTAIVQGEIVRSRRRGHSVRHPHEISSDTLLGAFGISKDDIRCQETLFWPKLKADIAMFIVKCQLVKAEHQHPSGLLQPLPILEWKWEIISMDFYHMYTKK